MSDLQQEGVIKVGSAIDAQGNQRYLSDIEGFNDLPDNCHFNKVLTGCGGTTVALQNQVKYVITMPFKGLGENKQKWANENKANICVIDGDSLDNEGEKGKEARIKKVKDYIKAGGKKVVVTYDSLPDVVMAIGEDINNWKLLVDESHMLLEAGSYRYSPINGILSNMKSFKSFCLMTATPVRDDYQLDALKEIPKVRIEWENTETVNIERKTTKKNIADYTALLVLDYLEGDLGKNNNAHIFLNSIISITDIMRKVKHAFKGTNLASQVKIVCAERSENKAKIKQYLGTKYSIGFTTEPAKKINFYTSTAFSGQDIFDEDALSYVIVDGKKHHTKVDITTTIPQIIGRIRNAKVKNKLVMMYSADEYNKYLDRAVYEAQISVELAKAKNKANDFKLVSADSKEVFINDANNDLYLFYIKESDELVVNEIAQKSKLNAFETQHATYQVIAGSENKSHLFTINSIEYSYVGIQLPDLEGIQKLVLAQKPDFKTLCLEYIDYKEKEINSFLFNYAMPNIEEGDTLDIIRESYNKLGPDKMKALGYRMKAFEKELIKINRKVKNHQRIRNILSLKPNDVLTLVQAKEKLQDAYSTLEIDGKPTAQTLSDYYYTSPQKVKHPKTGQRVDGIVIGAPKAADFKK